MAGRLMVRVDPGVYQHQKTKAAARSLNLNPCKVVYHLTMMWAAVHRRRTDGFVLDLKPDLQKAADAFNRDVGFDPGGSDKPALLKIFLQVGFLDSKGSKLWVHDWDDWQPSRARRSSSSLFSGSGYRTGDSGIAPETSPVATTGDLTGAGGEGLEGEGLPQELRGTNYFGQFMWWLVQGFGFHEYEMNGADPGYFKRAGRGVNIALTAETYIAIAVGKWGDDFDRRALSGRHAMSKVNAFKAFKRRRSIDTIIPLTATGALYYPSSGSRGGGVGEDDAGPSSGGTSRPDPSPSGGGSLDLGNHPKYGG